jgi:hypothetical protein
MSSHAIDQLIQMYVMDVGMIHNISSIKEIGIGALSTKILKINSFVKEALLLKW